MLRKPRAGLGIRRVSILSKSLLERCTASGFKGERNSSWISVIEREYEELEEDSYVREARKPYKVDFLTAIGKGVGRFSNLE